MPAQDGTLKLFPPTGSPSLRARRLPFFVTSWPGCFPTSIAARTEPFCVLERPALALRQRRHRRQREFYAQQRQASDERHWWLRRLCAQCLPRQPIHQISGKERRYRWPALNYFLRHIKRGGHKPHGLEEAFSWHIRAQKTASILSSQEETDRTGKLLRL
jgi:hypothetical protein